MSNGRLVSTQGIIVFPDYMDVYDFTPVQYPADDVTANWQTTHFNFHDIDENVLKLDVPGHDDPTMVRKLQDLSGIDPQTIPADDKGVMALFSGTEILGVTPEQIGTPTGMLGIPEFGTNFVRGWWRKPNRPPLQNSCAVWSIPRYRRMVGQCPGLD